jgi:hypothetical protein
MLDELRRHGQRDRRRERVANAAVLDRRTSSTKSVPGEPMDARKDRCAISNSKARRSPSRSHAARSTSMHRENHRGGV